jgi:hypothetical protein
MSPESKTTRHRSSSANSAVGVIGIMYVSCESVLGHHRFANTPESLSGLGLCRSGWTGRTHAQRRSGEEMLAQAPTAQDTPWLTAEPSLLREIDSIMTTIAVVTGYYTDHGRH